MTFTKKRLALGLAAVVAAAVFLGVMIGDGADTYRGKGYRVSYPSGWEIVRNEFVDVAFTAPPTEHDKSFRSNVNVVVVPSGPKSSLDNDNLDQLVEYLDKPENNFRLLEKLETTVNGRKATGLRYDIDYSGASLRVTIYAISLRSTYIFTYSSLKESHESHLDALMSILGSLREQ